MRTFDYVRPGSPDQAIEHASTQPHSFYLAGGTTLLDLVKLDVMPADHLVDLKQLALKQVEALPDGRLRIGTLVSNTELACHPLVRERYPVLAQAILAGASTQLRNKASTGGNAPIPKPSRSKRVMADTEFTQFMRGAATPWACIRLSTSWCGWEFFE